MFIFKISVKLFAFNNIPSIHITLLKSRLPFPEFDLVLFVLIVSFEVIS